MDDLAPKLSSLQRELLARWLPRATLRKDHSWGLVDTAVLEFACDGERFIVKAGGEQDRHIAREIHAHRTWTAPWLATGSVPELIHADFGAKILVTRFLRGVLVEGTPAQTDPASFHHAGALLAVLHGQSSDFDAEWNDKFRARIARFLDMEHRIDPTIEHRVRAEIEAWPTGGAEVVPTHGDWQPRNWLTDDGAIRVIDLGRADLRPRSEDFVRLARQDFASDPRLEAAFLAGYGSDPREPGEWRRALVGEAVGTAVWAYGVGDREFERFGHELLARLFA